MTSIKVTYEEWIEQHAKVNPLLVKDLEDTHGYEYEFELNKLLRSEYEAYAQIPKEELNNVSTTEPTVMTVTDDDIAYFKRKLELTIDPEVRTKIESQIKLLENSAEVYIHNNNTTLRKA
jgi:hypothetical protein